jgi:arylsulfatase A-like enzyme
MVYLLDEAVGAIVTRLEAKGLRSRTLIWFLSDNGGNPAWGASNAPFRDGKASSYEGGVRVPAFLHVPGRPGDQVEQLAAHVDILPTTLRLLELPRPSGLDGLDISGALLARETAPRILYRANQRFGDFLRDGPLKIVRSERAGTFELYDLSVDPSEATDLALRHPAELERLTELWNSWYQPRLVVRRDRR